MSGLLAVNHGPGFEPGFHCRWVMLCRLPAHLADARLLPIETKYLTIAGNLPWMPWTKSKTAKTGTLVGIFLAAAVAAFLKYWPHELSDNHSGGSKQEPAANGPIAEEQTVKSVVEQTQRLEFLKVYEHPSEYRDLDTQTLIDSALEGLFVSPRDGGSAAADIMEQIKKMAALHHHYGSSSHVVRFDYDSVSFPTPETATVSTHEQWHLPIFDNSGQMARNSDISSDVKYKLKKVQGKWLLISATNRYRR